MKILPASLEGLLIIEPRIFSDPRGFFVETYQKQRYSDAGIDCTFVQDNLSHSSRGVLRGLHYQLRHAQAKLVQVLSGVVYDVVVDIRRGSPTFGQWLGLELSQENGRQLFVPEGFAHGFCVLSDSADFVYKCTDYYTSDDEMGIHWDDPELNIDWPLSDPLISDKDHGYPRLSEAPAEHLPLYEKR
jgi:dTDP-4-dehydrorhamnose 3,5-epimerase